MGAGGWGARQVRDRTHTHTHTHTHTAPAPPVQLRVLLDHIQRLVPPLRQALLPKVVPGAAPLHHRHRLGSVQQAAVGGDACGRRAGGGWGWLVSGRQHRPHQGVGAPGRPAARRQLGPSSRLPQHEQRRAEKQQAGSCGAWPCAAGGCQAVRALLPTAAPTRPKQDVKLGQLVGGSHLVLFHSRPAGAGHRGWGQGGVSGEKQGCGTGLCHAAPCWAVPRSAAMRHVPRLPPLPHAAHLTRMPIWPCAPAEIFSLMRTSSLGGRGARREGTQSGRVEQQEVGRQGGGCGWLGARVGRGRCAEPDEPRGPGATSTASTFHSHTHTHTPNTATHTHTHTHTHTPDAGVVLEGLAAAGDLGVAVDDAHLGRHRRGRGAAVHGARASGRIPETETQNYGACLRAPRHPSHTHTHHTTPPPPPPQARGPGPASSGGAAAPPHLLPQLVEEDDGAVVLGRVARNLAQSAAHQASLGAHCTRGGAVGAGRAPGPGDESAWRRAGRLGALGLLPDMASAPLAPCAPATSHPPHAPPTQHSTSPPPPPPLLPPPARRPDRRTLRLPDLSLQLRARHQRRHRVHSHHVHRRRPAAGRGAEEGCWVGRWAGGRCRAGVGGDGAGRAAKTRNARPHLTHKHLRTRAQAHTPSLPPT